MWDQQKRVRFEVLRQREFDGTLTEAEQTELSKLIAEVENLVPLDAATKQVRQEREQIEQQNRALNALLQRKQALIKRLNVVVDELETEQKAISEEFARIIDQSPIADTGANR